MYDINGWVLGVIGLIVVSIVVVEGVALSVGINGNGLTTAVGGLCGLGGFLIRSVVCRKKKED